MKTPSSPQKKMIAGASVLVLLLVVLLLNQKNSGQKSEQITQTPAESSELVDSVGPENTEIKSTSLTSVSKTSEKVTTTSPSEAVRSIASQDGSNPVSNQSVGVAAVGVASQSSDINNPGAVAAAASENSKGGFSWFQKLFGSTDKTASAGATLVGSTPSSSSVGITAGVSPAAEVAKIDNTPDPGCREVVYTQKSGSKFKNRNHKNFLKLEEEAINFKSVCVRVDGVPVRYDHVQEKGKNTVTGLMLGAIAGPDSRIVLTYCLNKLNCNDTCAIPKDEFMDAIGGYDAQEDTKAKVVRWDPSDAEADRDVTAEVDADIKREMAELDMAVSADWAAKVERQSCQMATARSPAPKTGRSVASAPSMQE